MRKRLQLITLVKSTVNRQIIPEDWLFEKAESRTS